MADISKRYKLKWSELTPEQKEKSGSKAEHSARRDDLNARAYDNNLTRKGLKEEIEKGTSLRDINQLNKSDASRGAKAQNFLDKKITQRKEQIYGVDDLEDFDTTTGGSGSNSGKDKISKYDLKALDEAGHSREEIISMVDSKDPSVSSGAKAQKLLNKWKSEFVETEMPDDPVDTTQPADPVDTTQPADPVDTTEPPGDTTDPVEGTQPADPVDTILPVDTTQPADPVDNTPPANTGPVNQENEQSNNLEDVQNTDITDSFNGGTVGDISVGDGSNVEVDNSNNSRYYGGDNRVININKNYQNARGRAGTGNYGNSSVDTTMSDLTMAEYDKPSDSPAANASFVSMYQGLSEDAMKKYDGAGQSIAQSAIDLARNNNPIDIEGIQKQFSGYEDENGNFVPGKAQKFYDQSNVEFTKLFGDIDNFSLPKFVMPGPPKPIEDNLDELADKYSV